MAVSALRELRYNRVMRRFTRLGLLTCVFVAACTGGSLPDTARQAEGGEATDTLGQEGEPAVDAGVVSAADSGVDSGLFSEDADADSVLGEAVDAGMVRCDPRGVTCKRTPPSCGDFEAPAVVGACYGACVRIERCACERAADCPDEGRFTCHLYAQHCGPYVH